MVSHKTLTLPHLMFKRSLHIFKANNNIIQNQRNYERPATRWCRSLSGGVDTKERASISFSVPDRIGALEDILASLRKLNINVERIESRPSRTKGDYDFYLDFVSEPSLVHEAVKQIQTKSKSVQIVSAGDSDGILALIALY